MTENMKKFLVLAKENEVLSERLKNGFTNEELTALAMEQGITLTKEDFSTSGGTPLTDEELDKVAAGTGGKVRYPGGFVAELKCDFCGEIIKHQLVMLDSDWELYNNIPSQCPICGMNPASWFLMSLTKL